VGSTDMKTRLPLLDSTNWMEKDNQERGGAPDIHNRRPFRASTSWEAVALVGAGRTVMGSQSTSVAMKCSAVIVSIVDV
jgi:hypothetical protein